MSTLQKLQTTSVWKIARYTSVISTHVLTAMRDIDDLMNEFERITPPVEPQAQPVLCGVHYFVTVYVSFTNPNTNIR